MSLTSEEAPRQPHTGLGSFVQNAKVGDYFLAEDGQSILRPEILDAIRMANNAVVVLKQVMMSCFPYEVAISQYLSSEPLASDSRNHCVPIYEVLDVPDDKDLKLLVMPLLHDFTEPRFLTVGEAVECRRQLIEDLDFMHTHHVAHRDIMPLNIMMDPPPLFPDLFHFASPWMKRDRYGSPKHYTRTGRPTKYYYIDLGLSRKFNPAKGPSRSWPIWGGDRTVPEFQRSDDPCDPFPIDIYYLGNTFRKVFLEARDHVPFAPPSRLVANNGPQGYKGMDFMKPLVDYMVQDEPTKRPTIGEVVARFNDLLGSLGSWRLRSRLRPRDEHWTLRPFRNANQVVTTVIAPSAFEFGYVLDASLPYGMKTQGNTHACARHQNDPMQP
ncbi:hypothetical protein BD414DRAFT_535053 [Trametes punicea]|nr:hypothetical protein BD414DRAFT_535053 [Trametes punicea]